MPPVVVDPKAVHEFLDSPALERWMKANCNKAPELWIRIHKKGSALPTVTIAEALDVMLCWGWIDGVRKSLDASSFLQRYTPRRAKSIWSIINSQHVERLTEASRMQPSGFEEVAKAKADGRWDNAYAGVSKMVVPPDLAAAINANPKALRTFETLTSQNRYALGFRLGNIKTAATRERKIADYVEMLARNETFYPNRKDAPTKPAVKKAVDKKPASKTALAKQSVPAKGMTKKTAPKKAASKKAVPNRAAVKKTASKKTAARKSPSKRSPPKSR